MSEQTRVLGPMGDEVVFENDRVRIWELTLPPGVTGDLNVAAIGSVKRIREAGLRQGGEPEPRSALLAKSRQGISIGGCQGFPLAPVVGLGTAR